MPRRKTTKPDGLKPKQHAALRALLAGATVAEAARKAGCKRQTVSGWLNRDGPFRETYDAEQDRMLTEARGVLRAASVAAGRHLLRVIEDGNADAGERLQAAAHVLRTLPKERTSPLESLLEALT